jgi:hypothetical protein
MGKNERKAYLEAIRGRYRKASRAAKTRILDEFCAVCGYHRKYALRCLNRRPRRAAPRRPGRPSRYADPAVLQPLRVLWLATDQLASKRLRAAIPLWLPHYEATHGALPSEVRAKLLHMSPATIDRLLQPVRASLGPRGLCGTKPGTLLKTQIPLQGRTWDVSQPGFMEADTVAHCGDSLAGDFIWSLTMTDLYSGWTECRATWNKGAAGVLAQVQAITTALPFTLQGFDCDNGSEFLNWHLLRYFQDPQHRVQFTRSRPYHKNDNAHVEQKNWSCVRQLFGYRRLDQPALVAPMNDLYANEFSRLVNFFYPTLKLTRKARVGARITKQFAPPQTPAQRLLDHPAVPEHHKAWLRAQLATLNPFTLSAKLQRKLRKFFALVR